MRSAFHRFEARWCASVFERLSAETQRALDAYLRVDGPELREVSR
jgi:hypothetical protein